MLASIAVGSTVSAQMSKDSAPEQMDSAQECESIGLRLREMVANGELTPEQAHERYGTACRARVR